MTLYDRARIASVAALFVIVLVGIMTAQVPEPAQIEGVVTNSQTGRPLDGVVVTLTPYSEPPVIRPAILGPPPGQLTTETDIMGRFELNDVPPGSYTIDLSRQGFYRTRGSGGSLLLRLDPGTDLAGIPYRLTPKSAITGRVVDEDGQPVPSVTVAALQTQYESGRRVLRLPLGGPGKVGARAVTDEVGEYRLFDLESGNHYVVIWGSLDRFIFREGPPLYYPGFTEPEAAVAIAVPPGVEIPGIDFEVRSQELYTARFRLIKPNAPPYDCSGGLDIRGWALLQQSRNFEVVHFADTAGVTNGVIAVLEQDDVWRTTKLAPGSYELYHDACPSLPMGLLGHLRFDIVDSDINAGALTIRPGFSLHGQIKTGVLDSATLPQLRISLRPLDRYTLGLPYPGRPNVDRVFTFDSESGGTVPTGRYWVDIAGLPAGVYLESSQYGARDLADGIVVVDASPPGPLQLTLGGPGAIIKGVVEDAFDQPVPDSQVVLVPERYRRSNPSLFRAVTADQHGRFEFRDVPPGQYTLLAWEDVQAGAYQNEEFLTSFESIGVVIPATPGVVSNTRLQVISRP